VVISKKTQTPWRQPAEMRLAKPGELGLASIRAGASRV
jgi:hypothetical protein